MKLKQEDRNLLREFFESQYGWMKENSLLNFKNLNIFKQRFLDFKKSKNCEENLACKLFELTLEHELLHCKKNVSISAHNKSKLKYIPIVKPATDNIIILSWINEAKIIHEVSRAGVAKINASINQKIQKNEAERKSSYESSKNFIVK